MFALFPRRVPRARLVQAWAVLGTVSDSTPLAILAFKNSTEFTLEFLRVDNLLKIMDHTPRWLLSLFRGSRASGDYNIALVLRCHKYYLYDQHQLLSYHKSLVRLCAEGETTCAAGIRYKVRSNVYYNKTWEGTSCRVCSVCIVPRVSRLSPIGSVHSVSAKKFVSEAKMGSSGVDSYAT